MGPQIGPVVFARSALDDGTNQIVAVARIEELRSGRGPQGIIFKERQAFDQTIKSFLVGTHRRDSAGCRPSAPPIVAS